MTTSTWSLWAAVFRPLVIGIGAGLIVALLLYVLGVSCVWLMGAIAGGTTDVENMGGNDAGAEGTGHPCDLEMGARNLDIAEGGESADQPLVSASVPNEEMEA